MASLDLASVKKQFLGGSSECEKNYVTINVVESESNLTRLKPQDFLSRRDYGTICHLWGPPVPLSFTVNLTVVEREWSYPPV